MKHISFFLTTPQIRSRSKDVTRRLGWSTLRRDTRLKAVVKGQGLKKGERMESLGVIRVVAVWREPLRKLIDDPTYGAIECRREGFPDLTPAQFVAMFCASHKGCTPDSAVTRIEFMYEDEVPA